MFSKSGIIFMNLSGQEVQTGGPRGVILLNCLSFSIFHHRLESRMQMHGLSQDGLQVH